MLATTKKKKLSPSAKEFNEKQGKYLYCIAKESKPIHIQTPGIESAPVYVIEHQGLSCIISDTDNTEKELSKESAIAHEKVLEEVMQHGQIVPIAFGHIAQSEEEIKTKLIETNRNELDEWLNRLQGKIELSIKAFWFDLTPVLQDIASSSEAIRKLKARVRLSRNDQMLAGEIAAKQLGMKREEIEKSIIDQVGEITHGHKKCNLFGEQMITNLAFLIDQKDLDTFDLMVNTFATKIDENMKLKYTGPVPPYNFVQFNINLS